MKDKKIGFVGVGRMGANMARHLKDEGWSLSAVYDINTAAASELAEELGCTAASSLSKLTADSAVVITVVTNDAAMRAIFIDGEDNLLQGAEGTAFLNCATLSPGIHQELEAAAKQVGATTLEACMASSISHARSGNLYLMLAGEEAVFEANKELLEALSCNMRFVPGGAGKAAEVKALVNMVMNMNTAALAEGLGLGTALGHDIDLLCEVFSQTGANSRVLETDAEDMRDRDHECWFSADHAAKDSGIAADLGTAAGHKLPVNEATLNQYKRMVDIGLGELDKSGIAELTFPGRKGA